MDHVPLPLSRAPDGQGGMTLLHHVAQLNEGGDYYGVRHTFGGFNFHVQKSEMSI